MPRLTLARRMAYGVDRLLVDARWHRSLTAQLGPLVAESVLARAWRDYLVRLAALPPGGLEGSRLVQRWTVLAIALYRALRARGVAEEPARAALRNLLWDGMRAIGFASWMLAWRPGRPRLARTEAAMNHFRRLFFKSPGFAWREIERQPSRVGFDCLRCPIAQRFEAEGLADVAVHAVCSLDRRLAADWGVRFTRTQTLADGGTHCDFRWATIPAPRSRQVETKRGR